MAESSIEKKEHSGVVVDHGVAKYQFKDVGRDNYFVKLETDKGERTIWGVDLQKALKEADINKGDSVTLTKTGSKAVDVSAPVLDKAGQQIDTTIIAADRNDWKAVKNNEQNPAYTFTTDKEKLTFGNPHDAAKAFLNTPASEQPRVQQNGKDLAHTADGVKHVGSDEKFNTEYAKLYAEKLKPQEPKEAPIEKYTVSYGVDSAQDNKQKFDNPKDAAIAFYNADPQDRPFVIREKIPGGASIIADCEGRGKPGASPSEMQWTKTVGEGTAFAKAYEEISRLPQNTISHGSVDPEQKPSQAPQPAQPAQKPESKLLDDPKQDQKPDQVKPLVQAPEAPKQAQSEDNRPLPPLEGKKPIFDKDGYDLPSGIKAKYAVDSGKFFTPNSASHVFQDHGKQLATVHNDPKVVADMVAVAKAKGWTEITLSGSEDFRRQGYLQAESQGISTKGYKPTEADKDLMERMKAERSTNKITSADQPQNKPSQAEAPRPSTQDIARAQHENRQELSSEFNGKQVTAQKASDSWKTTTETPVAPAKNQNDSKSVSTNTDSNYSAKYPTPKTGVTSESSVYDSLSVKDKARLDAARLITADALRNLPKDKQEAAMNKFEQKISQHVADTGKLPSKLPKPLTQKPVEQQAQQQKQEHTHKPSRSHAR